MTNRKKKIKIGNAFLTGSLFFLSGLQFIGTGKDFFALFQIIGGLLNIADGINLKKQFLKTQKLHFILGIANIILPLTIAVDYFQSGAKYIQYVWIFVAMMWTIAFIVQRWKAD